MSWFLVSLWAIGFAVLEDGFTEAATAQEIESLRVAASELGIAPGTWNFTTDPCVAGWRGISCCSNNSQAACCVLPPPLYPPQTPCERTAAAQVSMIVLRSDLFGQVLKGTVSESLCNLSSLRLLDLGRHRLKGDVPGCIGRLSNLIILRIGDNDFTGRIPEDLGNLSNLQELYLDSTNISGAIPSSLGKLSSLGVLYLRNNALEGGIPAEIGQLSNLFDLELQVNRLTGGIPGSFVNLSVLMTLTLFNNEFSGELDASVFQGMSLLTTLSLRRNRFTGLVPALSNFRLVELDLGFNQFSGSIPAALGSLPTLSNLFLGHNMLNGTIPTSFSALSSLARLDLSHNMLVGSLTSITDLGVTAVQGPPQLDLSFNFFDTSTASSLLPAQRIPTSNAFFNCIIPRSFSNCSRSSSGTRTYFSVNVGGDSVSSSSHNGLPMRFDVDKGTVPSNQSVGLFYGTGSWALELSGDEAGVYTNSTAINMTGAVAGVFQQELYSSMRWSSSYMAYHGIDLMPGNYVVALHFAELVFTEPGYRMFDVIVQGQVVKRSLDIVKEAGPLAAYVLTQNINVSDGSVSLELVYTKPDRFLPPGVWPVENSGPILSAISVVSADYRGESGTSSSKLTSAQIAGIAVGSLILLGVIVTVCVVYQHFRRRKRKTTPGPQVVCTSDVASTGSGSFGIARPMPYQELYEATNGFSEKLGQGGFGAVYKGTLSSGVVIAVKQLLKQNEQIEEFKKEISIISNVRHRNLLAVIGHSLESDIPMLVCEFLPNGSLDQWLFRRRDGTVLSWEVRRKIAIGVSCGLAYLHDESKYKIIHCDVKPANILLDSDFNPRIADFGLARLYDGKESHVTATRLKGTLGYLAPEYAMHLQVSDKVDVYSFGVVLLELLSGRHAVEFAAPSEQVVLVDWAHKEAQIPSSMLEIMDERLQGQYFEQEARDMATIAILCTQRSATLRPKMQTVWLMLNGTIKVPEFLENLSAVIRSAGGSDESSSTGNLGESSISAGFTSLKLFPGSNPGLFSSSASEEPVTY